MTWSSIVGVCVLSALVPFVWVAPSWHDILFGVLIGVASTAGQWIVVLAFRYADASVLAPFSYTQLVWVSLLGFVVFGEVPDIWTVTGAAFIVASGLYTAHREHIRRSRLSVEAEPSPKRLIGARQSFETPATAGSSGRGSGDITNGMAPSDSDRPPVLAHRRVLEDKESFAGLNLAQRFQRIRDTNLWGAGASSSGLGSEMDATTMLRAELPRLLKKLGVASLLDAPCGDAGWINQAGLDVRYAGVDIVPALIEALQARAAAGEINGEYRLADIA